jgi:hypothetical protein
MNKFGITQCYVDENSTRVIYYRAELTQEEIDEALQDLPEDTAPADLAEELIEYAMNYADFEWLDDGDTVDTEYEAEFIKDGEELNSYDLKVEAMRKRHADIL